MYRNAGIWNNAYRIAKQEGGDTAQKQVNRNFVHTKRYFEMINYNNLNFQIAYLWAKCLNSDDAVKLLQKFKLLDESIDYACENG